tara:strand:- start:579 stop:1049 length:471 start_codon:yes stop_codon:yes gene_type:complete
MIMTHDFRDSDGDGIDDRKQSGPGVVPDYMKNRPGAGFPGGPPIKRPPKGGGGRPPRGGGWSPKPPRRGKTVKGSRPRPPMPSPRPPMFGGGRPKPPMGGGRPPRGGTIGAIGGAIGGRPPRGGRTVKGSRPRPPMPSPKPPMGGGRPPIKRVRYR